MLAEASLSKVGISVTEEALTKLRVAAEQIVRDVAAEYEQLTAKVAQLVLENEKLAEENERLKARGGD